MQLEQQNSQDFGTSVESQLDDLAQHKQVKASPSTYPGMPNNKAIPSMGREEESELEKMLSFLKGC